MLHPLLEPLDPEQFVALRQAIEDDYVAGHVIALPDGWIVSETEARLFAQHARPPASEPDNL